MTDERDPKVSQRYRELPGEEPSRELDQTILAAAHRAADKPHAPLLVPAGRHRWYFSLGAAAILVLAVAVTVQVERQQPDAELTAPPAPAPAPQLQKVQPAPQAEPAPAAKARSQIYAPNPPPAEPAAPPAMETPRPDSQPGAGAMADSAEKARADQAQAQEKAAASRAAPSLRSSNAAATAQYAPLTPERELERIAGLRAQGRDEEADKALAEFRKRYPNYRIPQAMLEKVEKKPAR